MLRICPNEAATALVAVTLMYSPVISGQAALAPAVGAQTQPLDSAPAPAASPAPSHAAPFPAPPAVATGAATTGTIQAAGSPDRSQLESLGDLYVVRKHYVAAIGVYQQAAGDSPIVWNKLGIAYQHMFNNSAAKASYEHSLRLDPKYPEALNNLGTIYYAEKNYGGAARYYKKALRLSPRSAAVYANLGAAEFAKGDYKHGAMAYRLAFTIDPSVFEIESANKIEEAGSREARAMLDFHLAKFYANARMNDRALACLREALNNGFSDRKMLMGDGELAEIRSTPEFQKLLSEQGLH